MAKKATAANKPTKSAKPAEKPEPPRPNAGRYKVTRHPRTAEQPAEPAKASRYAWRPQDMGND